MDRIKLNRWLIALVAIALLVLVFEPEKEQVEIEIDSQHPEADYTMEDVTITQYATNGTQNHKLIAKKMIHYNRQQKENKLLENNIQNSEKKTQLDSQVSILVEPIITYKNQLSFWTLSAKQGRMTNQQTILFLSDQVELIERTEKDIATTKTNNIELDNGTINSTKVTTSDLEIDLIEKIAHTEQEVILQSQNITASSNGMKIDMEKSKVYLLSNVQTQLMQIKK